MISRRDIQWTTMFRHEDLIIYIITRLISPDPYADILWYTEHNW